MICVVSFFLICLCNLISFRSVCRLASQAELSSNVVRGLLRRRLGGESLLDTDNVISRARLTGEMVIIPHSFISSVFKKAQMDFFK